MSAATATIRELKNKETGIDLSVTAYKEVKGLLGSNYEFQIMVVSNLAYFKTAKHKDATNVQFTVQKKLSDFEELNQKLSTKFSGTVFPPLPKKVLMTNEGVAKERRNNLDSYVKFLASTPKLSTDSAVLVFLGVSNHKANSGKLNSMVVSDKRESQGDEGASTEEPVQKDTEEDNEQDLFDEGGNDDDDDDDDFDMFTSSDINSRKVETKIFDDQDLGGALEEGEGQDLFIEGAEVNKVTRVKITETVEMEEELSSDDDLDKIMTMKLNVTADGAEQEPTAQPTDNLGSPEPEEETQHETANENPQLTPEKPAVPKGKPNIPPKKPTITSPKPSITTQKPHLPPTKPSIKPKPPAGKPSLPAKPSVGEKPALKEKPGLKEKPQLKAKPGAAVVASATEPEKDLTQDDILKYIQDNVDSTEDLDLFS